RGKVTRCATESQSVGDLGYRGTAAAIYFGSTLGSPPGEPGGGMIFSSPPPGGATWMSRSTPAGGQITPLDCASLALSGAARPVATRGPLPLTSGGHATPCSGPRSVPTGCASAAP